STRLLGALVAAGTPIDVLARVRPTLEDVFLDLVGRRIAPEEIEALGARPPAAGPSWPAGVDPGRRT
ncbi:MAG: hypothetical protein MUE82_10460, partial [Chloroflexi bacterium]|nr:hypothetical protein [Chloroflexota bacterium]